MTKEITFEKITTENIGHIKDARLRDSGYLYLSDYYKLEDGTSLDMVVLSPREVEKLKELLIPAEKKPVDPAGLKNIIDNKVEDIFVAMSQKYDLEYGDMDPVDYLRLEEIKEDLLKVSINYLKINTEEK